MKMLKRLTGMIGVLAVTILIGVATVHATPSTTYWTPGTTDVQPYGVWHIGIDNYYTISSKIGNVKAPNDLATDLGLTVGVLPYEKINLEVGIDYLEGQDYPLFFNAKFGTPEGSIFPGAPALNLGIFNVGTKNDVTNYNIVHAMVGKSIPMVGRLHVGYYSGNEDLMVDKKGEKENDGFMIGYDRWIVKDKFMFAADYASGENALGGGGFGVYWFFAPNASLLTGPVWFENDAVNGDWKWTTQLDINF